MLEHRAVDIISSAQYIEVQYQGKRVWIESVDKDAHTACVMPCGSGDVLEVSISKLEELG